MPNVMLQLLDDEFLIAHDAGDEVADRYDADHSLLLDCTQTRHACGMSCLSAAEPIAIRVAWEPHVQRLMTASGPTLPTWALQQVDGYPGTPVVTPT